MKIAIYSPLNLDIGAGAERWIGQVASSLSDRGHRVIVLTTRSGNQNDSSIKKNMNSHGVRVFEFDTSIIPFKIPKISCFREIVRLATNVDILYFNNAFALNEILIFLIRKTSKAKVISGSHGTFPEEGGLTRRIYHRFINIPISKTFDAHHVLNKDRETILKARGFSNLYRIPNGVDVTEFSLKQKDDIFTVMFAGSMIQQKGIDRLALAIESLNNSSKSREEIKFIIFGAGPLSSIAKKLSDKFDNVNFFGYADRTELVSTYETSHVFVLPSRFEEFALVCLEAHAAGTPVIASDIPGPRDLVEDSVTGFIIDSGKPDEIVQSILHLKHLWYFKPRDYKNYCSNARQNALKYDSRIIIDRLEKMMISVAKQNNT
jgi:glycosyltransferase involved in cell wall biosynthesis